MPWKDFLYYHRGEKVAIITLLSLILIILLINVGLTISNPSVVVINHNDSIITAFESFYNSIEIDSNKLVGNNKGYSSNYSRYSATNSNKECSVPKQSYRRYEPVEKLKEGEYILLNNVDTTEWKKVPGIGSSFALRIVKYRNLLGGYASVEQLREVYGMDDDRYNSILSYIKLDNDVVKINVNKLEFKELLRHPYLNYEQVQLITNLRKKKGRIETMSELSIFDEFTDSDIARLEPYVEF